MIIFYGKITGIHGLKGEVEVAFFDKDYFASLPVLNNNTPVIIDNQTFTLLNVKKKNKSFVFQLKDINNIEDAQKLIGLDISVDSSYLPQLDDDTFYEAELIGYKIIDIDQSPIGRTPRSNPATYTDVFTHIRDLYAKTNEAQVRGYKPGRFSFNVKGGRCEACKGDGVNKIEMNFLSDVYVKCPVCKGKRYNRETLEVKFKGKTIADVLDMSVKEALEFFDSIPTIKNKLQTLNDVGLDYIKLGQSATTLSGGEAQRIKLASELNKRATGKTLYLLDEPSVGLHWYDLDKLIKIIQQLADQGNTILIIEHNLDLIKVADYIIDLGPEGGNAGGQIVATGTPQELSKNKKSITGQYLKGVL